MEEKLMWKCCVCGKSIKGDGPYFQSIRGLLCSEACHEHEFWKNKIEWALDCRTEVQEPVFRCNGEHYVIGAEDAKSIFRGHGGQRFFIYYVVGPFADKVFTTSNLWSQGKVPERYSNDLPDNAVILTESQLQYVISKGVPVWSFVDRKFGEDVRQLSTEERMVNVTEKYKR